MTPNHTLTPLKAVRAFALAHPALSGAVHVMSWTRGGKGGWATKRHDTTVFFRGGDAALTRGAWRYGVGRNGRCQVCGEICLDQVLKFAWAHDPEADALLSQAGNYTQRRAPFAHIHACQVCVKAHYLLTFEQYGQRPFEYFHDGAYYETRPHPTLARYSVEAPTHRLDLRKPEPKVLELIRAGGEPIAEFELPTPATQGEQL